MDPSATHALDRIGALLADVARTLGVYRDELKAHGFDEGEIWELIIRQEERMLGPLFDDEGSVTDRHR